MALSSAMSKSLIVLALFCIVYETTAYKSHMETCQRSSSNPNDPNNCDRNKHLSCNLQYTQVGGTCECDMPLVWDRYLEKCTYPLGDRCTSEFGGGSSSGGGGGFGFGDGHHGGNGEAPGCPRNAMCDASKQNTCTCEPGYMVDSQGTECNGGTHLKNVLSTTFGFALCYFIAIKLML